MLAWHFLKEPVLAHGDGRAVVVGETLTVDGPIIICKNGLHACASLLGAVEQAHFAARMVSPICCRVRLGGEIETAPDQSAASSRTVLWWVEAASVLHQFASWCARRALFRMKVREDLPWKALRLKRLVGIPDRSLPFAIDIIREELRGLQSCSWNYHTAVRCVEEAMSMRPTDAAVWASRRLQALAANMGPQGRGERYKRATAEFRRQDRMLRGMIWKEIANRRGNRADSESAVLTYREDCGATSCPGTRGSTPTRRYAPPTRK